MISLASWLLPQWGRGRNESMNGNLSTPLLCSPLATQQGFVVVK
jgi:hypothetical protein